jgi:hypothetical protein
VRDELAVIRPVFSIVTPVWDCQTVYVSTINGVFGGTTGSTGVEPQLEMRTVDRSMIAISGFMEREKFEIKKLN